MRAEGTLEFQFCGPNSGNNDPEQYSKPDDPMSHVASVIASAAVQVTDENPPFGEFPRKGMKPARMVRKAIRAAKWPNQRVTVRIVHNTTITDGIVHLGYVQTTDILIVPTRWMLRYIELLDKTPIEYITDGKYEE